MSNYFRTQTFNTNRDNKPVTTDKANDKTLKEILEVFDKLDDAGKRDVLRYVRKVLQKQIIEEIYQRELIRRSSN